MPSLTPPLLAGARADARRGELPETGMEPGETRRLSSASLEGDLREENSQCRARPLLAARGLRRERGGGKGLRRKAQGAVWTKGVQGHEAPRGRSGRRAAESVMGTHLPRTPPPPPCPLHPCSRPPPLIFQPPALHLAALQTGRPQSSSWETGAKSNAHVEALSWRTE